MINWAKRLTAGVILTLIISLFFVVATPQGKTIFHTVLFVTEILDFPVKLQSGFAGEPIREKSTYQIAGNIGTADIYRLPDGQPRAAVILFLGANAAGPDDIDVVQLGNALARAGIVTVFHWSPSMNFKSNIDIKEIENLVWAFRHIRTQSFVDPDRIGIGGFCVGASFALIAASDPRIARDIAFVNAFGPYYDARHLLFQISSRLRYSPNGTESWEPDEMTWKVFVNEIIESLNNDEDRQTLTKVFGEKRQISYFEPSGLSTEGQSAFRLLSGVGSIEEAEMLLDGLPEVFQEMLLAISPSTYISGLSAPVFILHDHGDELVPPMESRRLVEHLNRLEVETRYTELLTFDHVRPSNRGRFVDYITENYKLFRHMYRILRVAQSS